MSGELTTGDVISLAIGMMGAVGLWQLNSIRQDMREIWGKVNGHLQDRNIHTKCGKGH